MSQGKCNPGAHEELASPAAQGWLGLPWHCVHAHRLAAGQLLAPPVCGIRRAQQQWHVELVGLICDGENDLRGEGALGVHTAWHSRDKTVGGAGVCPGEALSLRGPWA